MAAKGRLTNPTGRHLRESVFRSFEPHIKEFYDAYPNPVYFQPFQMAATTFSCQLRAAITSLLQHEFSCSMDLDTLAQYWKDSAVRIQLKDDNEIVYLGPRKVTQRNAEPVAPSANYALTLVSPTLDQLNAACLLIISGATQLPVRVDGDLPEGFEKPAEIMLNSTPDGSHILL